MPNLRTSGPGDPYSQSETWWARGFDQNSGGAGMVCLACGALVARGRNEETGVEYWQKHLETHGE